jgi:trehalose-6-phosphate hydrolase
MQWNTEKHAGFTQGQPWLEVARNYPEINAAHAVDDPDSVFYFYQKLIQLRKEVSVITTGEYIDLMPEHEQLFCYARRDEKQTLLCLNNYYAESTFCPLPKEFRGRKCQLLLSNYPESATEPMMLRPYETRIILLEDE